MRRLLLISNSTQHGSGFLDHCEAEIRDFLGAVPRVLFVPFALHDKDGYAARARERFGRMGYPLDSLHEANDPAGAVRRASAFFVGGGNTFRLLDRLLRLGLLDLIRRRVEEGVPYSGASAGANLACPTIQTTNDMPIVQPASFAALGLIPFQINPHYLDPDPSSKHQGETRETRIREYHEENEPPVLGLREGGILRREGPRLDLRGGRGARLFVRGKLPVELAPGSDLGFLLERGERRGG